MPSSPTVNKLRARLAGYSRHPDNPQIPRVRRELDIELLAEHIERVVEGDPIPAEQRHRLAAMLLGGAR